MPTAVATAVKTVLSPFTMPATRAAGVGSTTVSFPTAAGCPPDCRFEFMCDSNGRLFRRFCCFRPDCVYSCQPWESLGLC